MQGVLVSNLQFAIMCVFRGIQSNPRFLELQGRHRSLRYSDGVFTCFVDG